MEENVTGTSSPNRMVVVLLGVIVLLLVAIIGYLVFGGGLGGTAKNETPAPAATSGMTGTTAAAPFDPATATTVPAGETPEQFVTAYFDAVVAGDYETAYNRLPTDKKAQYDLAGFTEQLKGYGVTAYTIDNVAEEGEEAQVTATATMPGGAFQYLWTFVKDGEGWLVKSRTLPGMSQ